MTAQRLKYKQQEKVIIKRLEILNSEIKARKKFGDYSSFTLTSLVFERLKLRQQLAQLKGAKGENHHDR